jgi:hypothetical protein
MAVHRRGDLVQDWRGADVLVMWQDVMGEMKEIAQNARMAGKKVYVAEHGLLSINDYIPPLAYPLIGNKYMCWGKKSQEYLNKAGIKDTVVTGTTIFNQMRPKRLHEGKNVLFAPRHWDIELPENIRIAQELSILMESGINVYSKIVEGEHNPDNYPNPISSNRLAPNHLMACYDALKDADILVTLGEGTIASLAYYLDIPVVSSNEWETKVLLGKTYTRDIFLSQVSTACHLTPLNKLNDTILSELKDPSQRRDLRLKFLNEHIDYQSEKSALEKQLEVIYGEEE